MMIIIIILNLAAKHWKGSPGGQTWRMCTVRKGKRKGKERSFRRRLPTVTAAQRLQPLRSNCMLLKLMQRERVREGEGGRGRLRDRA